MSSTATATPAVHQTPGYASEVRFGVVLYGGVSLAIYMNGVVNEMYELVCATPKEGPRTVPLPGSDTGTREIYRRLALLANNDALRREYAALIRQCRQQPENSTPADVWDKLENSGLHAPVRLVVDVVAGTSAGGINGIFLAKALTNGKPFAPLQDLWVQEGDIDLLLNDELSYEGLKLDRSNASLLNSGRMYIKLYEALEKMNGAEQPGGRPTPDRSLVDEIDLFITTTDIAGSPVPLRLSGHVVTERRHKQDFHFGYSGDSGRDDFVTANNAVLAFAARCTSSFPFAFEPMTMNAAIELAPTFPEKAKREWHKFLSYLPQWDVDDGTHNERAFGDGGYLDNKPFSYVAKTLSTRQALVSVERKLIYVEPAPESVDTRSHFHGRGGAEAPDALANSLAALTSIPRYETIREDLQEVLKRNRSIERVDRIVREGEIDLHEMLKGDANPYVRILKEEEHEGKIPPWPEFGRRKMVKFYGTAVLAYRRVRVSAVTDELAYRLSRLWDIDIKTDHLYAMTALLREWREWNYKEKEEEGEPKAGTPEMINAFFDRFDIDYRIRRLSFLLRQIDYLKHLLKCWEHRAVLPDADENSIKRLKSEEHYGWRLQNVPESLKRLQDALDILKGKLNKTQQEWRKRKALLLQDDSMQLPTEQERKQLKTVLSLLLGEQSEADFQLPLSGGSQMPVGLQEDTVQACACARTMQDSVMHRTKDLFRQLAGVDEQDKKKDDAEKKTKLYATLERSLESMRLPKPNPGAWEILGQPTLMLTGEPEKERAIVQINNTDIPLLNSPEGTWLRCLLSKYYLYFDLFDQMSFPLYHDAGIGEPATVEVVRISPMDATSLIDEKTEQRRKLAGTALSNFGAFLDRHWRLNDIMWGRLDGAERLIGALLPMTDENTELVREELTRQAHQRILRETFLPEGRETLTDLLLKANTEMQKKRDSAHPDWIHNLLAQPNTGEPRQHSLAALLSDLLNDKSLVDHVRKQRNLNRDFEPKSLLRNTARAITISGRMLDEISTGHGNIPVSFRWLARLGLIFQGLIAVSLPGSIKSYWRTHIAKLFYLFAFTLALIALPFGNKEISILALTVLVVVGLLHMLTLILGDILQSKRRRKWIRKGISVAVWCAAVLAITGGFALSAKPSRDALYTVAKAQLPPQLTSLFQANWRAWRVGTCSYCVNGNQSGTAGNAMSKKSPRTGSGQAASAASRIASTSASSIPW